MMVNIRHLKIKYHLKTINQQTTKMNLGYFNNSLIFPKELFSFSVI